MPERTVRYKEHGSDPRNYRVDFAKIGRVLGFEPAFSVDDGIREVVAAMARGLFDEVERNLPFYGNCEVEYG